ncbi:MAG TPA: hypothetical protein VF532_04435 [Candidatus Angelobacter sp.]
MVSSSEAQANQRSQHMVFAVLSLGAAAATTILYLFRVPYFRPYFGGINPPAAIALTAVLGAFSLRFLLTQGWFQIYTGETRRGMILSAAVATLFAVVVIAVDLTAGFPRDLNVPAPSSLLFYPVMAYVVEICFHAVPLALLLWFLGRPFQALDRKRLLWMCLCLTATLEPVFQVWTGYAAGKAFSWLGVYVGLQVFAINLLQLLVFWRYGFVAMYFFRLVYYIYWHIAWGSLRLKLLF